MAVGSQSGDRQVAIITGSTSGIGFEIARALASDGFFVVLSGRDPAIGDERARTLLAEGLAAAFVRCDVALEEDVAHLMKVAAEHFGAVRALVNNAGPNGDSFFIGPLHEVPSATFDKAMRVGAYAPFWGCKHAIPHMLESGGGTIVNIGAVTAQRSARLMGAYALSKAMLSALTRQVADDYGRQGIRCNAVMLGTIRPRPGDVSTLPDGFDPSAIDDAIARTTMLGRTGSYAEAVAAVRFLLSRQSSYITGTSIDVDGGASGRLQYPDYQEAMGERA